MALCAQHSKKLAAAAATSFQGLSVLPSTPCSIAACCMLSSVCALHPTPISPDWLPPRLWCGSPGPSTQQVDTIDTQDLLEGGWQGTTALLVMPGGADLPYCRRLNGRGNKLISGGDCGAAGTHARKAPISLPAASVAHVGTIHTKQGLPRQASCCWRAMQSAHAAPTCRRQAVGPCAKEEHSA